MDVLSAFWRGFRMRRRGEAEDDAPIAQPPSENDPPEVTKEPPMQIDGRVMQVDEFVSYVETLPFAGPRPTRVFLHHTWKPTRETWRGRDTILAMKAYYERQLWQDGQGRWHEGWTAGPHLFVADDGIWLFSDLRHDGVGVYGHNYRTRHLEIVGDYDQVLPDGPTLGNTVAALGILHERLGLPVEVLGFHRDFATKSCPGWAVQKDWIIPKVAAWIREYRRGNDERLSDLRRSLLRLLGEQIVPLNPTTALARGAEARSLLGALTNEIPMEIDGQAYIVQLFAEALIVPVNDWDSVQTLGEYERSHEELRGAPTEDAGEDAEYGDMVPPQADPFPFCGTLR